MGEAQPVSSLVDILTVLTFWNFWSASKVFRMFLFSPHSDDCFK